MAPGILHVPEKDMLHLCSGDMGLQAFRQAGLPGEALPWRDSPAVGPWNPDPDLRARLRAQFWGLSPETTAFREEEEVLQSLKRAGSVVLWFSAEPWDQLAQLWVLARLAREREWEIRQFTRPVRLRDRVPVPNLPTAAAVTGAAVAVSGAAMLAWRYNQRRGTV